MFTPLYRCSSCRIFPSDAKKVTTTCTMFSSFSDPKEVDLDDVVSSDVCA